MPIALIIQQAIALGVPTLQLVIPLVEQLFAASPPNQTDADALAAAKAHLAAADTNEAQDLKDLGA